MKKAGRSWNNGNMSTIKGLVAEGPDPGLKEGLMLFDQFVGDWDIVEARYPQAEGPRSNARERFISAGSLMPERYRTDE